MQSILPLLVLAAFLLIFAAVIYAMLSSTRRDRERKLQAAQALGFSPLEPDPALVETISTIYRGLHDTSGRYELRNVSRKHINAGECYLLDLIHISNHESSYPETQAVAILSPALHLPRFALLPKLDMEGAAARLANQAIEWLIAKLGPKVDFTGCPDFDRRYIIGAPDPQAVSDFFTPALLNYLAHTSQFAVRANQDGFIFSLSNTQPKKTNLTLQVQSALDVYDAFTRFSAR
ncbi:MAG: hypothetical protein IH586_22150 [Anaerolineaceae bacterium]|nr:hypothetical protein [Anaerolineaceae bacterium]